MENLKLVFDSDVAIDLLNHNLPLLTGNIKHFIQMPELAVINFEDVKDEFQRN